MANELADEQILFAIYASLPHPEQTRLAFRDPGVRARAIEDYRAFLNAALALMDVASPEAEK